MQEKDSMSSKSYDLYRRRFPAAFSGGAFRSPFTGGTSILLCAPKDDGGACFLRGE